jgi:hypothetical protein
MIGNRHRIIHQNYFASPKSHITKTIKCRKIGVLASQFTAV